MLKLITGASKGQLPNLEEVFREKKKDEDLNLSIFLKSIYYGMKII
jgi:hypothetical protein